MTKDSIKSLFARLNHKSSGSEKTYLRSGVDSLDKLLGGGLAFGEIAEWGIPEGSSGNRVFTKFLKNNYLPVLWISAPQENHIVNPPAWQANGIHLENIYFATSSNPIVDVKPVFLESAFKIIILDGFKRWRSGDLSFLTQRIRINGQVGVILHRQLLSNTKGNVFAKKRLNCFFNVKTKRFEVNLLKGSKSQNSFLQL